MLRIIFFYVPMGASALLAALTHVIINGVLARSEQPDVTISSYAVALSLSFLLDLPMNIIRQASSKFSRDQTSFRSVAKLTSIVTLILISLSIMIAWTPLGQFIFRYVFGVKEHLLAPTIQVYQILAFLYILTALRSLFQGVIINHLRTGWITVGMAIRVVAMFGMSWYFIKNGWVNDGRIGAWIFVIGVAIECVVSVWEGLVLRKNLPLTQENQVIQRTRQLLPFYMPLLYSSLILVLLNPSIQAALNSSADPTLAVASYAVAIQLMNMIAWFCGSVHQIVIQFYTEERRNVLIIVACLSVLAPSILLTFSSSAGGSWLLEGVLGLHGMLLQEVRKLLLFLAVPGFLFPWIDFMAGKCMLLGKTRAIMISKIVSVLLSVSLLIVFVYFVPFLNGGLAGLAAAIVVPLELLVVYVWLRRLERKSDSRMLFSI
jgi:O-antigen/teichoic acid export membrane protein